MTHSIQPECHPKGDRLKHLRQAFPPFCPDLPQVQKMVGPLSIHKTAAGKTSPRTALLFPYPAVRSTWFQINAVLLQATGSEARASVRTQWGRGLQPPCMPQLPVAGLLIRLIRVTNCSGGGQTLERRADHVSKTVSPQGFPAVTVATWGPRPTEWGTRGCQAVCVSTALWGTLMHIKI